MMAKRITFIVLYLVSITHAADLSSRKEYTKLEEVEDLQPIKSKNIFKRLSMRFSQTRAPVVDDEKSVQVKLTQTEHYLAVELANMTIDDYNSEHFYLKLADDTQLKSSEHDPLMVYLDMRQYTDSDSLIITPYLENNCTGQVWNGSAVKLENKGTKWTSGPTVVYLASPCKFYEKNGRFIVKGPAEFGKLFAQFQLLQNSVVKASKVVPFQERLKIVKSTLFPNMHLHECIIRVSVAIPGEGGDDVHTLLQSLELPGSL